MSQQTTNEVSSRQILDCIPKTNNNTISLKASTITKRWVLIDAKDLVLGRLATYVAMLLYGKLNSGYTRNADCGDNVILINADKISVTGKKLKDKKYYRHTGHPGGIKVRTLRDVLQKKPTDALKLALKGMLGSGPLANRRMANLYIYSGESHPHSGQQPVVIDFAVKSIKNKKNS